MPLSFNGTTVQKAVYDDTELSEIYVNGTKVFPGYTWNRYKVVATPVYGTRYRWSAVKSAPSATFYQLGSETPYYGITKAGNTFTASQAIYYNAQKISAAPIISNYSLNTTTGVVTVTNSPWYPVGINIRSDGMQQTTMSTTAIGDPKNAGYNYYYGTKWTSKRGSQYGGSVPSGILGAHNYITNSGFTPVSVSSFSYSNGYRLASGEGVFYFHLASWEQDHFAQILGLRFTTYYEIESYQTQTGTNYSRGDYIDQVIGNTSTAYPDNGQQGDYWYVKVS